MSIAGYTRTGRVQLGPASDLVEMQGPDGGRHTGIVFHPEYRKHNAINAALGVVLGFLESPMVTGLADLGAYDLAQSSFVYATGQVWSIAEVVRTLGDLGEVGGVRAGVELMVAVGEILVEAAENGENQGVYSHGGLTPWRVVLDAGGRPQVIGHALPQVEILTFHEHPDRVPREDAFRYCPPERMESKRENFSSDVFSLGLIAFEIMTGKPIYDGLVNDIRGKAARGETSRRIHQFRDYLPEPVRELLVRALRPDFRDRFSSGAEFLDAAREALSADPDGGRLCDMMERVSQQVSRAREQLDPARTSMLSKEELARLVDEEAGPVAKKPVRAASTPQAPKVEAAPVAPPPTPEPLARRLPPRLRDGEGTAASAPAAASAPPVASALTTSTSSSSLASLPTRRAPPRLRDSEPGASLEPASPQAPASPVAPASPPSGGESVKWSLPARRPNPRALGSEGGQPSLAPAAASPLPAAVTVEPPPPPVAAPPVAPRPPVAAPPPPAAAPPPPAARPPAVAAPTPASAPSSARPAVDPLPESARAVPPAPAMQGADRAADLLRRIRESSGENTRPTPLPPRAEPPAAPAPAPAAPAAAAPPRAPPAGQAAAPASRPPSPPAAPTPASAAAPSAAAPSAAAPSAAAASAPAPVPAAPSAPQSAASSPAPPAATTSSPGLPRRVRTPDPVRTTLRGDALPFRFCRGPGAGVSVRKIGGQSTLGDVVAVLVGQVVPLRSTTDGRHGGWYRLGPASGPLPASTRIDTVKSDETLYFHPVAGSVCTLLVDAPVDGRAVTLLAPVHTALTASSLVDALCALLALPAGDWALSIDGATVEPSGILEDHAVTADSRLKLVKA